jgi:hypothetical protein
MPIRDRWFLACGPLLGLSLVLLAVLGNSGPGFFVFSLVGALGLVVVAPLVQLVLVRVRRLDACPGLRAALGVGTVALALSLVSAAAVFNQW